MKKLIAVYPGTFDPFTNGHADLVRRACKLFDQIIVAIASTSTKQVFFPLDERLRLAKATLVDFPDVVVTDFRGLLVDFAKRRGATVVLRGLRAMSDFEYEFQLAGMNRKLAPKLESVFMTPSEEYAFLSSSLVREVALLGGDISDFVAPEVEHAMRTHKNK